jgi:hypothetical protein
VRVAIGLPGDMFTASLNFFPDPFSIQFLGRDRLSPSANCTAERRD